MRQTVLLPVEGFARQAIEAEAARRTTTTARLVGDAVEHFLADRDEGRPSRLLPRFARSAPPDGEGLELDLDLDDWSWAELTEEAEAEGVPVAVLLAHASLYLVADLNAGRVQGSRE